MSNPIEKVAEKKMPSLPERVKQLPEEYRKIFEQAFSLDNELTTIASQLNAVIGAIAHLKKDLQRDIKLTENSALIMGIGNWPVLQNLEIIMEGTSSAFNKSLGRYNIERTMYLEQIEKIVNQENTNMGKESIKSDKNE